MTYRRTIPVEFNHCDPAGIVFYPRYFEMINSVIENFFADIAGWPFAQVMAEGGGVPTARIVTEFHAPSRLGDRVDWALEVVRLGGASMGLKIAASGPEGLRVTVEQVLVRTGKGGRAQPWPDAVRARIEAFRGAA